MICLFSRFSRVSVGRRGKHFDDRRIYSGRKRRGPLGDGQRRKVRRHHHFRHNLQGNPVMSWLPGQRLFRGCASYISSLTVLYCVVINRPRTLFVRSNAVRPFQAGVDMRVPLAENLLVIGGTASLLGFRHRLLAELNHLANHHPKYSKIISNKSFKVMPDQFGRM